MDLKDLKKLIGENGRCVIIENDKPAYVIMTAKEFLASQENKPFNAEVARDAGEEKIAMVPSPAAKDILATLTQAPEPPAVELDDIMFDDLGIDELPD